MKDSRANNMTTSPMAGNKHELQTFMDLYLHIDSYMCNEGGEVNGQSR